MKRLLVALVLVFGCGEEKTPGTGDPGVFDDYEDENVTVLGGDAGDEVGDERITVSAGDDEVDCVPVGDNLCVPVEAESDWCKDDGGPVDIVIVDGEVAEVVCYPPPGNNQKPDEVVDGDHEGNVDILQNASNTAVVFDESTNGEPIEGDLNVAGNQVSIYGNGPEETIIGGDVNLDGNNIRMRGVTITGDLTITKNRAAVVLTKVLGDVYISGTGTNNSVFVENDVFGTFTAESNSHLITGNDVQGAWTITAINNTCDGNVTFTDTNEDQSVAADERGEPLSCPE